MDLGFEREGADVVFATDHWEPAAETYKNNFENVRFLRDDIRNITRNRLVGELGTSGYTLDDIDIVIGGPPCQGFSRLNNKQIELDEMEKDERNTLFEEFLRIVEILDPHLVLMENVRDLINRKTSDGDLVKNNIVRAFNRVGYKCRHDVLEAENYGVPQKRRRIFFVGTNRSVSLHTPLPTHASTGWATAGDALDDVPADAPNMTYPDTSEEVIEKIRHIPQGGYYDDLPDKLKTKKYRCDCENTHDCPHEKEIVERYGTYLRRLHPDEPSLTVNTNEFIHPFEDRYLTPREMARLQTFPDDFAFAGGKEDVLRQIGNAVPVGLAHSFAETVCGYYPEIRDKERVDVTVGAKEAEDVLNF
jgi:DNA (cytosine-5)-methyltransferase 1